MKYWKCRYKGGADLPIAVKKADTFWLRLRGLAWSDRTDRALWIVPCGSVHTFWMRYSLHVIFLDDALEVLKVGVNVPPGKLVSCRKARSVLEIPTNLLRGESLPARGASLSFHHRDQGAPS